MTENRPETAEERLLIALAMWAKHELDRLVGGRVRMHDRAWFFVASQDAIRKVEHVVSLVGGFASAEEAARAFVDEMAAHIKDKATAGPRDVLVWRRTPEISRSDGLRQTWRYRARWSLVRLANDETILDDSIEEPGSQA